MTQGHTKLLNLRQVVSAFEWQNSEAKAKNILKALFYKICFPEVWVHLLLLTKFIP